MKKCEYCQVNILDDTVTCPLCNRVLGENQGELPTKMYPDIEEKRRKSALIQHAFYFVAGIVAVFVILINILTYQGFWWAVVVDASILYLALTVYYSVIHHGNPAAKIVVEIIMAGILVVVIDVFTGNQGWALNYVVPGMVIVADFAIGVLMVINHSYWYSYVMYQALLTTASFVPCILLYITGKGNHPVVNLIAVGISVVMLVLTMIFKNGKSEMMRRFHT
ncbi:MAG: DUF6320 domain-containing protein [Anaerostipes sp.]|nr:DUF6320 domain-containing protein [Anaerostipes sp.]MDD3746232.1 DUF6320 domain-containing protein [Anaerostipes sp.]